jgi:hypothetical protein
MTSFRRIEANRGNAQKSTGPRTVEGKRRSRSDALRHGLTAETVIGAFENTEDYAAFEAALVSEYRARSVTARQLVVRLASVLWRLRRATAIETGLFDMQADPFASIRQTMSQDIADKLANRDVRQTRAHIPTAIHPIRGGRSDLAQTFLRLASASNFAFDRLSRYEASLWRQADQLISALGGLSCSERK